VPFSYQVRRVRTFARGPTGAVTTLAACWSRSWQSAVSGPRIAAPQMALVSDCQSRELRCLALANR
jgi:hypothetical protein